MASGMKGRPAGGKDRAIRDDMTLVEKFAVIFELPPAMLPHVDFVASEQEMALVVALGEETHTLDEVAALLGLPAGEAEPFLERAYHRQLIIRERSEGGLLTYTAATFYERMNPLAMYENWGDVPAEAREAVLTWQLQEFIDKWLPVVEAIRQDPDAFHDIPNRDYLLLEEALALVEAAEEHVVVPCDCRAIVMACDRPLETCIRLDEGARATLDAGMGRRISREECKQIVIDADRKGLMHTGRRDWQAHGVGFGFCNCCACDCYPIRAGKALGMVNEWPRSHHMASRDLDRCHMCGKCARRCHFEAFYFDGTRTEVNGKKMRTVRFDPALCVGCGICATGCAEGAITMLPITESERVSAQ